MNATDVVAIVTAVAAALTVGVSLFSLQTARAAEIMARDADRHERMPVLICPSSGGTTEVRNVGKGPALNIIIARAGEELALHDAVDISFDQLARTSWSGAAHLQPIESGETTVYEWAAGPAIGLSYTDALGFTYTTLASRYGTKVFDGSAMSELKMKRLDYPRRLA